MKNNVLQIPKSSPYLQGSLVLDSCHLFVQVPKRNGILWKRIVTRNLGSHRGKMLLEFAESFPNFRATTPFSRSKLKSKGLGKLSIHFAADHQTIQTIFRIIVFANQFSLYGAVANMCEECESLNDRSGEPDMVMGQSIVLSENMAEVPLDSDDPAYQNFLLQRYEERIKSLSQTDRVSKFCMDAGFLSVVEVGQYFMSKDIGEQFFARACREYTLPRSDESSQPKRFGNYDQLSKWQTWN